MSSILTGQAGGNHRFHIVADPFCRRDGLPFAEVLPAEIIEQAFAGNDALFGEADDEVFSTQIVLWAFLQQGLQDGKGAACAAAERPRAMSPAPHAASMIRSGRAGRSPTHRRIARHR